MRKLILTFLLAVSGLFIYAQSVAEGIYWTPDKKGQIEIYEQNGKLHARSVCCNEDKLDKNNPNPALRDRSTIGIDVMNNFKRRRNNFYTGGRIYNPENGKTYRARLWVLNGGKQIKVKGYIGSPMLGRTVVCERANS
ncbi:MAG: DUF2147 domain-containing protein [Bacteroidota bacterium]